MTEFTNVTAVPQVSFDALRSSMEGVGVDQKTSLRVIARVADDMVDRRVVRLDEPVVRLPTRDLDRPPSGIAAAYDAYVGQRRQVFMTAEPYVRAVVGRDGAARLALGDTGDSGLAEDDLQMVRLALADTNALIEKGAFAVGVAGAIGFLPGWQSIVASHYLGDLVPVPAVLPGIVSTELTEFSVGSGKVSIHLSFFGLYFCFDGQATQEIINGLGTAAQGATLGTLMKAVPKQVTAILLGSIFALKANDAIARFAGSSGFCINYFTGVAIPRF